MWYPTRDRTKELDSWLVKLEKTPAACDANPEDFLVTVSASIRVLLKDRALPRSYLRDWIWIGSQFRMNSKEENRARSLSRRALLFLQERIFLGLDNQTGFQQDINWVMDSTISGLGVHLGEDDHNSLLSEEEFIRVKSRLRELRVESAGLSADEEIALQSYLRIFSDLSSETYFPGIAEMVSRINKKIDENEANRAAGLSCLRYIIEKNDVVPDKLGYLGLVDDLYAIEETYKELENRATWEPILKHFKFSWPFLTRVSFSENLGTVRFSSHSQAIFGTVLESFKKAGSRTCIFLNETEICGLIAAFLACLESIRVQSEGRDNHHEFVIGEDIILRDSDVSIRARVAEFIEYNGRKFPSIKLKDIDKIIISEENLSLAFKASENHKTLSTHKAYLEWKKQITPNPLTYLIEKDFCLQDLQPKVLLITRRNKLENLLREIKPMGKKVSELVGIKYLTSSETEDRLMGTDIAEPLIWACSDAATAKELITSTDGIFSPRLVIVDDADLAVELEDIFTTGLAPSHISLVIICPIHEMEAGKKFLNRDYDTWLIRQSDVELVANQALETLDEKTGFISGYQIRQKIKAHVKIEVHRIQCESVEFLFEYLCDLKRKIKKTDDQQLEAIALAVGAFVRRFIKSPLLFDEVEAEELRRLLSNLIAHCGVLADYYTDVCDLLAHVRSILEQGIPNNPRQEAIENLIIRSNKDSITVICPSIQVAESSKNCTRDHEILGRANWITLGQLRRAAPFEQIIVPGWLDRRSMRELRNNGYALNIDLILYDFEQEWETKSKIAGLSWKRKLIKRMHSQWGYLERKLDDSVKFPFPNDEQEKIIEDEMDNLEEEDNILNPRFVEMIRKQALVMPPGGAVAKARLITFEEPGTYIYLYPQGHVISLSRAFQSMGEFHLKELEKTDENLRDNDAAAIGTERLFSCPVNEIQEGNFLAFPLDSSSDLLDSLADHFIPQPVETRRRANLWRTALQHYLQRTGKTIKVLQEELEAAGLKRHPFTIKMWLAGMHIIAPLNYQEAIFIIDKVSSFKELHSSIEEVKSAIDLIYRGRGKAAAEILRQLARRDIQLQEGTASVFVEGYEIQYRLHRVVSIDPPVDIAQERIGVLNNIATFTPHTSP